LFIHCVIVKCDMHVHSYFSGPCTTPILGKFCRESYSDPREVFSVLERRGMDLFTLTDHDSIDGSAHLQERSNFFLSEELTCRMPSGTEVHIGVYDFHERQHAQLQQRRNDLVSLLMYLTERKLFFSINHVFSSVTGRRELGDFSWFRNYFPAIETLNGHMLESANADAAALASQWDKVAIGGSDAHALASVGTAYTEVAGAQDKEEFFAALRNGQAQVAGEFGSVAKLTRDVFSIILEMMREKYWTALLSPLTVLVPAVTWLNYNGESMFRRRWAPRVLNWPEASKSPAWMAMPQPAPEKPICQ
jgi:predicted metal-dependent phosphoesterase TrpH